MLIAKIQVDGTHITRLHCDDIPRGIIGAQVEIEYTDRVWDGLNKTVVFYGGGVCKDVVTNDNVVTIPVEVVQQVGVILSIGVFGTDSDENIAIPTIRADLGYVRVAADPSGDESTDPSLPVWAQLNDRVARLEDEGVPGGSGESGEDGESAYEIAVRLGFEGSESEWLESLKGEDGKDGASVTVESVILGVGSGTTNTVIFSDGNMMTVKNGKDGKNGAPGTPGADGADGMPAMHSWDGTVLTITSASGTSSADLKGENGKDGKDGKSAYAYAVDGGYEGTEEEFSENLANGFAPSDAPVTSVNGKTGDVKVTYLAYGDSGGATESRVEMALATGRTPYFRIIGGKGGEYEGQEFSMYYQTTDDALYGRYKRADGNIFFDKVYTDRNPQPLTAESIVDALGYVPEEKSGVYELINTITLEGGESAVDITEDSAANVFALKAAFVKVETPASTDAGTGYIETYYGNQRISKHHISNIKQSSSTKVSKAEVMQRYGRWAEYTYGGAADGATANLINIVQFTNEATTMDCKYVDKVRVRVSNVTFDAGTKITVWGVRTNSSSGGNAEPLRITKQPVDVTIAVGNTVAFSVEAEGNGLTYQWEYLTLGSSAWKNNTQEGNTTATLTFKAQDYHNGYKYRCLITDAAGNTVRTNEVVLTINAAS